MAAGVRDGDNEGDGVTVGVTESVAVVEEGEEGLAVPEREREGEEEQEREREGESAEERERERDGEKEKEAEKEREEVSDTLFEAVGEGRGEGVTGVAVDDADTLVVRERGGVREPDAEMGVLEAECVLLGDLDKEIVRDGVREADGVLGGREIEGVRNLEREWRKSRLPSTSSSLLAIVPYVFSSAAERGRKNGTLSPAVRGRGMIGPPFCA